MSTFTTTHTARTTPRTAVIGAGTGIVAATLTTLFANSWAEVMVSVPTIALVTAVVWGYVVPRALRKDSAGGTALALAIVAALLVVPAFWSGLPPVLGVAALVVGNAGRRASGRAGTSIAAIVLAAVTVLFYLSIYLSEGMAGNTGFLLS